jgi:hypothetical protein
VSESEEKAEEKKEQEHNSPPGTGGVALSDGVVDGSNDSPKPFRPYYHPGLWPPLLFQQPVQVMLRWTGADFIQ